MCKNMYSITSHLDCSPKLSGLGRARGTEKKRIVSHLGHRWLEITDLSILLVPIYHALESMG